MKIEREKKMRNLRHIAVTLAAATAFTSGTAAAVQRAFVSAAGNDANTASNCTLVSPCRTFTAAMTVVDVGGEIVALDAAGYSAVTINKSVSIVANPGFYAGITATSGNAITIATPGVTVLLRGLNLNAIGGLIGVSMTNGTSLTVDNCVISGFGSSGIVVNSAGASVRISNTVLSGNGNDGLELVQGKVDVVASRANGNARGGFSAVTTVASSNATLNVSDSTASGNAHGFLARANAASSVAHMTLRRVSGTTSVINGLFVDQLSGTALAVVGNSTFTENMNGFNNNAGTLRTLSTNVIEFNSSSNVVGVATPVSGF